MGEKMQSTFIQILWNKPLHHLGKGQSALNEKQGQDESMRLKYATKPPWSEDDNCRRVYLEKEVLKKEHQLSSAHLELI